VSILNQVKALLPVLRAADEALPLISLNALRDAGLLVAMPHLGATDLCHLLITLGQGNLAAARLFEAHVNALQLIQRYGPPELCERAARDAAAGHWFALWVTDPPEGGLRLQRDGTLAGEKWFCSGAGFATRALMTAGSQMVYADVEAAQLLPGKVAMAGMRGAVTSAVDLTGLAAIPFGDPGDYLREPIFSAGAWRSSAAAVGGLAAVLALHAEAITARGRETHPQQRVRFGQAVIAFETARLWAFKAAAAAAAENAATVADVNLARIAIERACLEGMQLAQRSLGLPAFAQGAPIERVCRDLSVFLRQPAPDEVLDLAAAYYFSQLAGGFDASRR
jgi:alkylation response protein AidB-like acyl-CoA dehydrogenase